MTAAAVAVAQVSRHSRQLAVCTFADEKTTTPTKVGELPWKAVVALHANRRNSSWQVGSHAWRLRRERRTLRCQRAFP